MIAFKLAGTALVVLVLCAAIEEASGPYRYKGDELVALIAGWSVIVMLVGVVVGIWMY